MIRRLRVALLAHDLTTPQVRGLARYSAGLARALASRAEIELVLCSRDAVCDAYDDVDVERWQHRGRRELLWEQVDLPRFLRRARVDVLHAPSNRGLPAFPPCPTVLTRHDAIERLFPPDFPSTIRSRLRMYYSDEISVRRATRLATVSETSRRDILRTWSIRGSRVVTLGEGIDDRFFSSPTQAEVDAVRRTFRLSQPYLLYLGGFEGRKDVATLVEAFARWRPGAMACVLAGSSRGELGRVTTAIDRHGLDGVVRVLGELQDDVVPALMAGAVCFVYPSRYEGFGLQVAECLALGVPLVVSDGGALPETAGGHAAVFPAGDATELARVLERELADRARLSARAASGRVYAERFRWSRVVGEYAALYRELSGIRGLAHRAEAS